VERCLVPVHSLLPPLRVIKTLPLLSITVTKKLFFVAQTIRKAQTTFFFISGEVIFLELADRIFFLPRELELDPNKNNFKIFTSLK
jgi:hypothetical protein